MKHWPIVSAAMDLSSVSADVIYRATRVSRMEHALELSESIPSLGLRLPFQIYSSTKRSTSKKI